MVDLLAELIHRSAVRGQAKVRVKFGYRRKRNSGLVGLLGQSAIRMEVIDMAVENRHLSINALEGAESEIALLLESANGVEVFVKAER